MKDYIRREVKFLLYIVFIFFLLLVVVPLVAGQSPGLKISDLIHDQRMMLFLGLLLAYILVYPVIAYTTVKRYLNGTFADNREVFEKAFESLQYIKTLDSPDKIVYRKKSKITRFLNWGEDSIIIKPHENPVTISGLRKYVTRVDRIIDRMLLSSQT